MKKRFSLFITLALTTFLASGCSLQDIFSEKEQDDTEQKGDSEQGEKEQQKEETNFNVSFNANGGSGEMASTVTNGARFTTPLCEFTYENHKFNEWALNSPTGVTYRAQSTIRNINSDIVLYATWIEDEIPPVVNYNVTFNANGGTGTMESQQTNGSSYTVPECLFTYTDYTFAGWALNSVDGSKYNPGSSIENINNDIVLYATWSENTPPSGEYDGYYDSINIDSATLLSDLRTLNMAMRTNNITYSGANYAFRYTDYDPSQVQYDSNNQPYSIYYLSFYSGKVINSTSSGSYNKEHVWPNSRGGGSKNGKSGAPYVEDDIYMPRPTIEEENSSRGNSAFVEGMNHSSQGWDPVTAFANNIGVYTSIRGECARIIFYCMTVNGNLRLVDDANTDFAGEGGRVTMGKLSDLLKWNLQNPVNDREIRRQSGGQYLQGNRNAFVDHPEYACKIWGNTNSQTRTICGM